MARIHPADAHQAKIIAEADYFQILLFLGRGEYDRRRAGNLAQAKAYAIEMKAAHPECSRHPLIYAVAANGESTIVAIG